VKAVVDTNVFVSYLLAPRGAGTWLLHLWSQQRFQIIISPQLHNELLEVLERPHIASHLDNGRKLALLRRLRQEAIWTEGTLEISGAMPDPGDDILIGAAREENADYIVTWDAILLAQRSYEGVQIITPDEFIAVVVAR